MIKLIATDIDGTLVKESSREVYPEMIKVVREWTDRGGYFCAASGRQYYSIRHMFEAVSGRMIYIAENGAYVRYGEEEILLRKMRRDYVEQLIIQLREYYDECDVVVSTVAGSLLESTNEKFLKYFKEGYGNKYRIVPDVLAEKEDILKVAVYREGSIRKLGESTFIPQWKDKIKACMAGEEWVDFMDASVDKGNALKVIQEYFHITPDETMTFGDSDNDIGMLEGAAVSYAVESARDNVKACAKYVCPSHEKKGVCQVIAGLLRQD